MDEPETVSHVRPPPCHPSIPFPSSLFLLLRPSPLPLLVSLLPLLVSEEEQEVLFSFLFRGNFLLLLFSSFGPSLLFEGGYRASSAAVTFFCMRGGISPLLPSSLLFFSLCLSFPHLFLCPVCFGAAAAEEEEEDEEEEASFAAAQGSPFCLLGDLPPPPFPGSLEARNKKKRLLPPTRWGTASLVPPSLSSSSAAVSLRLPPPDPPQPASPPLPPSEAGKRRESSSTPSFVPPPRRREEGGSEISVSRACELGSHFFFHLLYTGGSVVDLWS